MLAKGKHIFTRGLRALPETFYFVPRRIRYRRDCVRDGRLRYASIGGCCRSCEWLDRAIGPR